MNTDNIPDKMENYPFEIRPLTEEEGGGWLITFPDLPGCMSDGESIEEAIENGRDAFSCWMWAHLQDGRPLPKPGESRAGRFVQRLPKSMHLRLQARAKQEGVSVNTLVATFIAEGLGKRQSKDKVA
jgi:antitoxin HicB